MNETSQLERERHVEPSVLDIIKVDGRWAQVYSGPGRTQIGYLDDGSKETVDLSDYELVRHTDSHVRLQQMQGERFTDEEIARIRWGSEQDEHPDLKYEVHVFGEYAKRDGP